AAASSLLEERQARAEVQLTHLPTGTTIALWFRPEVHAPDVRVRSFDRAARAATRPFRDEVARLHVAGEQEPACERAQHAILRSRKHHLPRVSGFRDQSKRV